MGYSTGVGRQAPTFISTAADGSEIDLKEYRGDWYPIVVFVSGQTPGVEQVLTQLSSSASAFWGLRGQLLGVCDASLEDVKALAGRVEGLSFPLVADDGHIAAAYGALKKNGESRAMAVVIDRAGKIVWEGDRLDALKPSAILTAFRQVVR